jgi:predicted N-acetyltransferase YhbS
MIIRDLYRSPVEDLHKAIAASTATLLRRGVISPPSEVEAEDVVRLASHPDFDPSLSFVAYEGPDPVAFLISRLVQVGETREAVWPLLGGAAGSRRALEALLDDTLAQWRREGARRARKGAAGLLLSEPRLTEDAELLALLKEREFEVTAISSEAAAELKKLATPKELADRAEEMRQKGFLIRAARPDEALVVARQYDRRHIRLYAQEFWNLVVRHMRTEATLVVEHRRQIIGFATFLGWTLDRPVPSLGPHFVDEAYRKGGLDAALLHEALLLAKQNGKEGVRAFCEMGRTEVLQKAGFTATGRFCHEAVADLA